MRMKRPYVAKMREVRITRKEDTAIIEYLDGKTSTVNFTIGPDLRAMTDEEVLSLHNRGLVATMQLREENPYVAVEIPEGRPQLEYFALGDQWTPRGNVIRAVIEDDQDGDVIVYIDDKELTLPEFGRMLRTYAGWGMRILFVPDDELNRNPPIEVREPTK